MVTGLYTTGLYRHDGEARPNPGWLTTTGASSDTTRWAATVATKDGNKENQACNRGDIKATREGEETPELDLKGRGDGQATREGEETPELDLGDRGDIKATREGEETSKLDLEDRGDEEATREGEETPKLDLGVRGDIKATGCIKPVITKEEESPGKEGDTREDEGSRNTYQAAPCLRYQAKEEEEPKYQAGELHSEDAKLRTFGSEEAEEHSQVSQLYHARYLAGSEEAEEHSQVSQLYHARYLAGSEEAEEHSQVSQQQDIPKHLEDLEDEGVEGYLEDSEVDILHDGHATHELQEQQDSLKGRGDPGKATTVQVNRKKTSSKDKAKHEGICQVGNGRYPAHNFVQHLKDEGTEKYLEDAKFDSLHDGTCQVGDPGKVSARGMQQTQCGDALPEAKMAPPDTGLNIVEKHQA